VIAMSWMLMLQLAAAAPESLVSAAPSSPAAAAESSAVVDSGPGWRVRDLGVVAPPGAGRGQVLDPEGLTVDAFGRVYVADGALHRVQRLEPDGRPLWEAGQLGSDAGQFRRPSALALLGGLSLAVLDVENRRVVAYDLFGHLLGVTIDFAALEADPVIGRVDPIGLAADRGGALVVADAERDRLLSFDFSGRFVRAVGGFGQKPGSFRGLGALAVGPRGELVTTERAHPRVQWLDASGRPLSAWTIPEVRGRGVLPIAVDDSSRVAVAEQASGRLWVFDRGGTLLASHQGLARPRALAFSPDGSLLVAESNPGRVRRLALEHAGGR
jgi:DNA-binding beta-propeller fold protein YncE